jgi:hypothetical protein
MMTLVLILLTWSTAVFVCVLTLSSMRRAMRKLKEQQQAEHYARKRELAGLPPYDQRGPLKKWLAQKASTKAHEETERDEREAFRRHCAAHIFRVKI